MSLEYVNFRDAVFLSICLFLVGFLLGGIISSNATKGKYQRAILEGKIEIVVSTNKAVKINE